VVSTQRDGKRVIYRLADEAETDVVAPLGALRHVAEHAATSMERVITAYFRARDELEPVAAKELLARLRQGDVVVLDVRPEDEYGSGHLPGALNIPLRQLEQRLAELPRKREIVAYCRGPYCVLSFEAVAELRTRASRSGGWKKAFLSGRPPACQSRWRPDDRHLPQSPDGLMSKPSRLVHPALCDGII
jgi:ArsR family transcriptional regulator